MVGPIGWLHYDLAHTQYIPLALGEVLLRQLTAKNRENAMILQQSWGDQETPVAMCSSALDADR